MAAPDLSPILRQQNEAVFNYGMNTANNAYDKAFFARRGSRDMEDFRSGFERQFPSFSAQQTQRGMGGGGIESGVMMRAMRNRIGDYTQDMGRMQEDYNTGLTQFDTQQALFDDQFQMAMDDLNFNKAFQIASTADGLTRLRQMYGGM
jgi:hypothetical protein